MRKVKQWRVRHGVVSRYLSPETKNGEAVWVDYFGAELFSRRDAEKLAKHFGGVAEKRFS